jgi:hypothetical protein
VNVNVGDIIFQLVVFGLIILFFVSFALFIRSLINKQRKKVHSNSNIEAKLDKIIELLEKDK